MWQWDPFQGPKTHTHIHPRFMVSSFDSDQSPHFIPHSDVHGAGVCAHVPLNNHPHLWLHQRNLLPPSILQRWSRHHRKNSSRGGGTVSAHYSFQKHLIGSSDCSVLRNTTSYLTFPHIPGRSTFCIFMSWVAFYFYWVFFFIIAIKIKKLSVHREMNSTHIHGKLSGRKT